MQEEERHMSPATRALEGLPGLFQANEEDDYCHEFYFSELGHSLRVLQGLAQQRRDRVLCDVTLCVGDVEFPCHRNVLAACSPYFLAMFSGEMRERREPKITIESIDPDIMKQLIDYAYTSDIIINQENAQHLLSAANMIQMCSIRDACCRFLEREMDPSNCLGIHCFAEAHTCQELSSLAKEYALENFSAVVKYDEVLLLSQEKLVEFLEVDELCVDSEEAVLQAVINWVRHDARRHSCLGEVLQYVRLPLVDSYFLFDQIDAEPLLTQDKACRQLVEEAMKYFVMKDRRSEMDSTRTRPRCGQVTHELLMTVGGEIYNKNYLNSVDCYNYSESSWVRIRELPFPRCHHGTVVSDGQQVYVSGGFNKEKHVLNNVLRYERRLDKWIKVANMLTPRARHGMASLDGYVYAVGGYDGQSRIASTERYSPDLNTWIYVAPMKAALSRCQAVGFRGALYVGGGTTEPSNQCAATLQRYTPRTDTWEWLTPMPVARWLFGLVSTRGLLYAVGGTEDMVKASRKLFAYNPRNDTWSELAEMIEPRFDAGVAVVQGKIYVLSGHDGENSFYNTIEEYDIDTNTWRLLSHTTLPYGRCRFGCVSLSAPAK